MKLSLSNWRTDSVLLFVSEFLYMTAEMLLSTGGDANGLSGRSIWLLQTSTQNALANFQEKILIYNDEDNPPRQRNK